MFITGSPLHPKRQPGYAIKRFIEEAFRLKFGKSLDEIVAETIEEKYGAIIAELRIHAEQGDEGAQIMLRQRVLELEMIREVRVLLKAPGAAEALEADRKKRARPAKAGQEQA